MSYKKNIKKLLTLALLCVANVTFGQLTFSVTNNNDAGAGSLREQLQNAEAIAGLDTVDISGISDTINLQTALPQITQDVVIIGSGQNSLIINCDSSFRAFFILNGNVLIKDLTIYNGLAAGQSTASGGAGAGMGGAIYMDDGNVVLHNITFLNNIAKGGDAGISGSANGGSGPFETGGIRGGSADFNGIGRNGGNGGFGSGGGAGSFGFTAGGNGGAGGYGAGGGAGAAEAGNGSFSNGGNGGMFGGRGETYNSGSASGLSGGAGAGLGGAIFTRQGNLVLRSCVFFNNEAIFGTSAGAIDGQGKGGAIFNYQASLNTSMLTYAGNSATDADGLETDNDSIYGVLTPIATVFETIDTTLCFNESIIVNGTTYDASVVGAVEAIQLDSKDSIITINLTVLDQIITEYKDTITTGEIIIINGTTYDENNLTGVEVFANAGAFDCDSTVNVIIHFETATSSNEILFENLFTIYPNPSSGAINIDSKSGEVFSVTIFNSLGAIVDNREVNNSNIQLTLEPGIYFIKVNNHTKKVIVQ